MLFSKKKTLTSVSAIVIALSLAAGLSGCQTAEQRAADAAAKEAAQQAVLDALKPDLPAGFKDAGNGVAYRFANEGNTCSYRSCVFVELYAYYDCPSSVYVEGNTIDTATNTVYGMTNDTLSSLASGQRGIVELTILEDRANGVQLTDISCY